MNSYNIKVEIQGIDTSKLPRLSSEEQMEMLRKIKSGREDLKEDFINANLRLVLSLIKRFNNRGENINDIFQVGVIGLIKAIDNFDITQPVQFSTYAVPMILGELKRYLRDNSPFRVTRSLRDLSYLISQEREKYVALHNEEPTVDDLAKIIDAPKEQIILAIDSTVLPMSIYDTVYSDGGDEIYLLDQLGNEKEDSVDLINKIAIEQMLDSLSSKEKDIIIKRYFKDKTQIELAEELGVSQAQISRIEKGALLQYPKHKVNKVVTPEENQTSDGWKFFYREYGLADVYENKVAGIYLHNKA